MRRAIRVHRGMSGDWSDWHSVWILKEHTNSYRIWGWRWPFSRLLHKNALGERIESL